MGLPHTRNPESSTVGSKCHQQSPSTDQRAVQSGGDPATPRHPDQQLCAISPILPCARYRHLRVRHAATSNHPYVDGHGDCPPIRFSLSGCVERYQPVVWLCRGAAFGFLASGFVVRDARSRTVGFVAVHGAGVAGRCGALVRSLDTITGESYSWARSVMVSNLALTPLLASLQPSLSDFLPEPYPKCSRVREFGQNTSASREG